MSATSTNPLPENLLRLLRENRRGALVTLKRDGRPQLSTVDYCVDDDGGTIRVSVTDTRAKTRNLRRDPRAGFYLMGADGGSWVTVEGTAELTPVAREEHDATVEELVEVYRRIQGEHPDWDDYRRAMVADGRLVVRLRIERGYGNVW